MTLACLYVDTQRCIVLKTHSQPQTRLVAIQIETQLHVTNAKDGKTKQNELAYVMWVQIIKAMLS